MSTPTKFRPSPMMPLGFPSRRNACRKTLASPHPDSQKSGDRQTPLRTHVKHIGQQKPRRSGQEKLGFYNCKPLLEAPQPIESKMDFRFDPVLGRAGPGAPVVSNGSEIGVKTLACAVAMARRL